MSEAKITEYSQVPWFRRNGFVFLAWLLCWPVAVVIFWTGEVYYVRNGKLLTSSKLAKAVATFIAIGITAGYVEAHLMDTNQGLTAIEESAVPVVSQIIRNEFGDGAAECRAVEIVKVLGDDFYMAKAILDNGYELDITIEREGDRIMVDILPEDED